MYILSGYDTLPEHLDETLLSTGSPHTTIPFKCLKREVLRYLANCLFPSTTTISI